MRLRNFSIFILVVIMSYLSSTNAETCEEIETSHVKLDLAKQSISNAKSLYPKCEDETDDSNCTAKDRSLAHLNAALDLIAEAKMRCHNCPEPKVIVLHDRPMDCSDIQTMGFNKSGVYQVWPRGRGVISNESIDVYCDMKTDGGGWIVIQRRGNFSSQTDFYQDWKTYKNGFGDIKQEFWLGNEKIFTLTNQGVYSARFDLVDAAREYRYAEYKSFFIGDEYSGYVLHVQNHTGNATDDMHIHNGQMFSTKDRTNDRTDKDPCAQRYRSAFWFGSGCGYANLNGIYQPRVKGDRKSIWWYNWKQNFDCLSSVEIKIRRKYA